MDQSIRLALKLHPLSRCSAVAAIDVEIARAGPGILLLRYRVSGTMRDLRLPLPLVAPRADELWRHTCFELFLCPAGKESYYEFNFAPSLQWAGYRFDSYRQGMTALPNVVRPQIEIRQDGGSFELDAALELDRLANPGADAEWRFGLSAVIEEADDRLSYWASTHPPGKPDFHHPEVFAFAFGVHPA